MTMPKRRVTSTPSTVYFDVRKANDCAWLFHEQFGDVQTSESNLYYFFQVNVKGLAALRERYHRFMVGGAKVVFP